MANKIFVLMLFMLSGLCAFADDTDVAALSKAIYIESGNSSSIENDGTVVIPIKMKNDVGVTGWQFDLVLPDGISAEVSP